MIGGIVAASLYVLAGLGIAGPSPGAAMFFAPWATREMWGPTTNAEDWWMVASLLLAGAGAGLYLCGVREEGLTKPFVGAIRPLTSLDRRPTAPFEAAALDGSPLFVWTIPRRLRGGRPENDFEGQDR